MLKTILLFPILALLPAIAIAQATKPALDNERVTVWDVDWSKGAPPANDFAKYDCVVVFTKAGQLRKVSSASPTTVVTHAAGEVMFLDQLAVDKLEAPPGSMVHTVLIFIKNGPLPALENKSGQPNAFPRPGGKRVMNNARFTTWDYAWTPGQPTPMHFHDKDVVVIYLEDGSLKSTTPDGQVTVNDYTAGSIRYNARDRIHTEEVVKGTQHALITEIK